MKLPHCKHPCGDCPFRKDTYKGWLGSARMRSILDSDSFTCHKNNDLQCAGHMLIKGEENAFVALAKRLYISLPLKGRELIFDNNQDCIDHHSNDENILN